MTGESENLTEISPPEFASDEKKGRGLIGIEMAIDIARVVMRPMLATLGTMSVCFLTWLSARMLVR